MTKLGFVIGLLILAPNIAKISRDPIQDPSA